MIIYTLLILKFIGQFYPMDRGQLIQILKVILWLLRRLITQPEMFPPPWRDPFPIFLFPYDDFL